ncbi:Anthranilate synthase component 1 [Corynebacterium ciconiae DSM 44920]|uniref:anthranilate synthase component 1 n=1 Tax=Corynebacterium ciconiae TaxID=227319 RepID=UPI00036B0F6F|nr:anthranilate synthase component 1 [Corynebacterium ciconiae]WKD62272.1 Anthranilate synthase component 1 [Corynebacterium ciconiae DSM 44920]
MTFTTPPHYEPTVLRRPVRYHRDASEVYRALCLNGPDAPADSVLLESVDIESKRGVKSLSVLSASLRLTCTGHVVKVDVVRPSGEPIAAMLAERLAEFRLPGETLAFSFPPSTAVDEKERLLAPSTVLPLRILQSESSFQDGLLPFLAGGFAFDYLATFEELPEVGEGPNTYPDYQFILAETLLDIDHRCGEATLARVSTSAASRDSDAAEMERIAALIDAHSEPATADTSEPAADVSRETLSATCDLSDARFREVVTNLKDNIYEGDIYQVVPARTFSVDCPDAFAAYRQLRASNPSPYMFYVHGATDDGSFELFGASPESNLKFTAEDRTLQIYPVAGTQPRGLNPDGSLNRELDIRNELLLRTDDKETAEHAMLVDLARNDLARVAVPGTRAVDRLMQVDRYSRVMHLVSIVSATLAEDFDPLDAYRACMNMGTLTGAPKLKAVELLRRAEGVRRGSYGGAVGYLAGNGDMDNCIVIRSAFVRHGRAHVQAGAGVVRDSVPQSEADETVHKAYAVLHAIAAAAAKDLKVERA